MPSEQSAILIQLADATAAAPSETYGGVIVIGEDPNKLDLFDQVKTYYSQSEVEDDFGPDRVKAVNVMKDDGTGNAVADYDTVLTDLEDKKVDYDIMVVTIEADDTNAQKVVDHAGAYHKVLVLPFVGDKNSAKTAFSALTANEYVFAVAHDDVSLEAGELSGAVSKIALDLVITR